MLEKLFPRQQQARTAQLEDPDVPSPGTASGWKHSRFGETHKQLSPLQGGDTVTPGAAGTSAHLPQAQAPSRPTTSPSRTSPSPAPSPPASPQAKPAPLSTSLNRNWVKVGGPFPEDTCPPSQSLSQASGLPLTRPSASLLIIVVSWSHLPPRSSSWLSPACSSEVEGSWESPGVLQAPPALQRPTAC